MIGYEICSSNYYIPSPSSYAASMNQDIMPYFMDRLQLA